MKSIESIVFQPSRVDRQNRLKSSRFVRLDRFQGLVGCWRGYLSGARCRLIQLMPLSLTVSCFSKIQIGFTFLESAHPGSPGQRAVKWMCVFVCVCVHANIRRYEVHKRILGYSMRKVHMYVPVLFVLENLQQHQQTIDVGSRLCCVAEFEQASISPSGPPLRNWYRTMTTHSFTAFLVVVTNVLHCLLPDKRNHVYQLRSRRHDCTLTANDDTRNFIYRLLHCDIYWFVTILSFLSHCLRCVMSSFH